MIVYDHQFSTCHKTETKSYIIKKMRHRSLLMGIINMYPVLKFASVIVYEKVRYQCLKMQVKNVSFVYVYSPPKIYFIMNSESTL